MPRSLVTMALPYANGSIHLGHLVEAVQTDIYVRSQKAMGRETIFICADDAHGTPIEVNAAKAGVAPEAFVARFHKEHGADYAAFDIAFDLFYTTHSEENRIHLERIYQALRDDDAVDRREVEQYYCDTDKRFLPDRFIKGTCPKCGATDQYGDACEVCGSTYEPTDLKDPACVICRTAPVRRSSAHYFVRLSKYQDFLRAWTSTPGRLQPEIRRFLDGWLAEPLKDWDISRDAPYFGFKIPGEDAKYFYVWLDAPVGYLSSTDHWAKEHGRRVEEFFGRDADCDLVHFIGKDIVYFHTLFWPAMLQVSGWKVPSRVHVHGMLTVEGAKMSKSRGTFLNAREYLDAGLDPEWLRYFYAGNLGASPTDIDLSLSELKNRVNGELLNNVGNLANRSLSILWKSFEGRLGVLPDNDLWPAAQAVEEEVSAAYQRCDSRAVVQAVLAFSSRANERLQRTQPWKLLATDRAAAQSELTLAVNVARVCARLLAPIVPRFAEGVAEQSGAALKWGDFRPLENTAIREPRPLVRRVDDADVKKLASRFVSEAGTAEKVAEQKSAEGGSAAQAAGAAKAADGAKPADGASAAAKAGGKKEELPPPAEIAIDVFAQSDLRAGKILACERVPKADRLLKLSIDLGEAAPRIIVSGVAKAYAPEELVGKVVCVVANLAPREMRGVVSHGMVLFASGGPRGLTAVELPADVAPGTKVK